MLRYNLEDDLNSGRKIILDNSFFSLDTNLSISEHLFKAREYASLNLKFIKSYSDYVNTRFSIVKNCPNIVAIPEIISENQKFVKGIGKCIRKLDSKQIRFKIKTEEKIVSEAKEQVIHLKNSVKRLNGFFKNCSIQIDNPGYVIFQEIIKEIDLATGLTKYARHAKGISFSKHNKHRNPAFPDTDYKLAALLFYGSMFYETGPCLPTRDFDIMSLTRHVVKFLEFDLFEPFNLKVLDALENNPYRLVSYHKGDLVYVSDSNHQLKIDGNYIFDHCNIALDEKNLLEIKTKSLLERLDSCSAVSV